MLPHLRVDDERRRTLRNFRLERRIMRLEYDPFALVDEQFIDLYRLNKDMVNFLLQEISPHMNNSTHYSAVHPHIRIFATLVFYGTGTYQRVIGQSYNLSVSQQTVTRCIKEVTSLIVEFLSERFIIFPRHNGWKNQIKETFMEHTQFPGIMGAIDCTHIAIIRPREEEHNYMNRKGYHSKNIQIICDYNLRIMNMNARYPGSCHDSFIWRNSVIQEELSQCYAADPPNDIHNQPPNDIHNQPPPQPNDDMDNNRTLLIEQYFT
ncbi:hypothetical protein JTB14_037488 [Gonioctena quinquepunctata]|nr:hypothetical protein JTB14_037488 [Gonioctena quinquepunctata]